MKAILKRAMLALVFPATTMALSGCGDVLDWRNAEVSNGKIFRRGADEPFSGKLSGIPESRIMPFNSWLDLVRPIDAMAATAGKVRTLGAVCNVKISKGALDGKAMCESPQAGSVRLEMKFSDGLADGDVVLSNGDTKILTAAFKDGRLHGEHKIFSPTTKKRVFEANWVNGKREGEVAYYLEDTGAKVSISPYRNGVLHGEVVQYNARGKLVVRKGYREGREEGVEEHFHTESGKKLLERTYAGGRITGEAKRWNEDGTLIEHYRHGPGFEVTNLMQPKHGVNVDACVDKWLAAHRKEVGADAMVRTEQMDEWEQWCRDGKQPA